MRSLPLAAAVLSVLAACATGSSAQRPSPCPLEILWKAPERPYDVVGEFTELVRMVPAGGAPEVFRGEACALGAEALLVTKHVVTNALNHTLVGAQAIKFRKEAPAPGPSPSPAPAEPPAEPVLPAPGDAPLPAPSAAPAAM